MRDELKAKVQKEGESTDASKWREVAHFMYGKGFWYVDPFREIKGLEEEQLFWVPGPSSYCTLWHVGHIAHREEFHIRHFLQGADPEALKGLLPEYELFGDKRCTPEELRRAIESVTDVFEWVREVRENSHEYIESLSQEDLHRTLPGAEGLSPAHWLFITSAHTALHIGRIQLLRALIEGKQERAC